MHRLLRSYSPHITDQCATQYSEKGACRDGYSHDIVMVMYMYMYTHNHYCLDIVGIITITTKSIALFLHFKFAFN